MSDDTGVGCCPFAFDPGGSDSDDDEGSGEEDVSVGRVIGAVDAGDAGADVEGSSDVVASDNGDSSALAT